MREDRECENGLFVDGMIREFFDNEFFKKIWGEVIGRDGVVVWGVWGRSLKLE